MLQEQLDNVFTNQFILLVSQAGLKSALQMYVASQKSNMLPTELSGRPFRLYTVVFTAAKTHHENKSV